MTNLPCFRSNAINVGIIVKSSENTKSSCGWRTIRGDEIPNFKRQVK